MTRVREGGGGGGLPAGAWMDQAGNTAPTTRPVCRASQVKNCRQKRNGRIAECAAFRTSAKLAQAQSARVNAAAFEAGAWRYVRRIHTLDNFTIKILNLISNTLSSFISLQCMYMSLTYSFEPLGFGGRWRHFTETNLSEKPEVW